MKFKKGDLVKVENEKGLVFFGRDGLLAWMENILELKT